MPHFKFAQDIVYALFLVPPQTVNKNAGFFFVFFGAWGGKEEITTCLVFRALRDLFPLTEKIHFASVRATVAV